MSIRAGSILHVAGQNVVDRIQEAGLGNVNLPVETIREVGNREVVDKVVGEPNFTFTLSSYNVSCELMAFLCGENGSGGTASGTGPGHADPEGTEYNWLNIGFVNIASPWKNPATGSAGVVEAGHLIPGYFPTKYSLSFGVTADSMQKAELAGGSFFYAKAAPREQKFTGNGGTVEFETENPTVQYRKGGVEGTTFRNVFGVLVGGVLMTEGDDFEVSGGDGSKAKVTFFEAPGVGADIRMCYFTTTPKSYPDTVHASSTVLPGAVRGRNILIELTGKRLGGVQTFTLEASVEGEVEREMGTEDIIGYVVKGTDCKGTITLRPKDVAAYWQALEAVTGVSGSEVVGWFNNHLVPLVVKIENPKNPGQILKTIQVMDAKFQPPGTPTKVNSATDFSLTWESLNGTFAEIKGSA